MVKRSPSAWSLALALSPALWALPGIPPAVAHPSADPSCYTPPFSLTLSPCVPHDVPAGPAASIAELAVFAWQEFVALNWVAMDPASTGIRGRAAPDTDPNTGFLGITKDATGSYPLLVWQTYRHKNELFPPGGTDASFDSKLPTYDYVTPNGQPNNPKMGTGLNGALPSFNLFNNLDETSQIGQANMYAHSTSVPPEADPASGIRVAYEAKVNRAVFQYLVNSGFTSPTGGYAALANAQANTGTAYGDQNSPNNGICSPPMGVSPTSIVMLPCGDIDVSGDLGEGAIEIKAAWRALTKDEVSKGRFLTQNVIYYTGQSPQLYNNAVWGLVALHIIHKTKSFPAFVFASWEQIDNYGDDTPDDPNPENLAFSNTGDSAALPDIAVRRAHAINSAIPPVNDAVHAAFKAVNPDTVWQYYKLIGVQATPMDPPDASATPDDLSYYYMANIMVETNQPLQNFSGSLSASIPPPSPGRTNNVYVSGAPGSPFQMGGCQGCHGFQGQYLGGDMSVLVAQGASNSQTVESIDSPDGTSIRTYRNRVSDVRERSGVSLRHFFPRGDAYANKPAKGARAK
jgi:hypothetical protein